MSVPAEIICRRSRKNLNATRADLFPFFTSVDNRDFRADINATSDMAKIPFSTINPIIMIISSIYKNKCVSGEQIYMNVHSKKSEIGRAHV